MKKGIIIYYSQSGSTQMIAQAIQKGMIQSLETCNLARLKEVQPKDLDKYDLIGLGSGVWGGRPSINVENFIINMTSLKGKHCFYFCTHGVTPGNIMLNVVPALKQKGLTVIGWNDWYGKVCIPYMPTPYYTEGHPDEIDLKESESWGIEMAERSLRISQGETDLIPELPEGQEYIDIYGEHAPSVMPDDWEKAKSKPLIINKEKCVSCGLCVESCPQDNIEFCGSTPVFKNSKCRKCYYCEKICPQGAIEYDWDAVHRMYLKYSQIDLERWSKVAEEKGHFRRLVPIKDVNWNNPWYKVTGHPRLVIP